MVVVFLGEFDNPAPEVVACKNYGLEGLGNVTLLSGSLGSA